MINPPNVDDDRKAEERTNTNQLILAFVYSAPQFVFQLSRMVNNVEFFSIDSPSIFENFNYSCHSVFKLYFLKCSHADASCVHGDFSIEPRVERSNHLPN